MKRILVLLLMICVMAAGCTSTTLTPAPLPTGAPPAAPATGTTVPTTAPTSEPLATPTQVVLPTDEPTVAPSPTDKPSAVPSPSKTASPAKPSATPGLSGNPGATAVTDPLLAKFIEDAKADLATTASISIDSITVKSVTPQEWNNAALGCPLPGIFYIQVIVPGYVIVLNGGGRDWEYHAGMNRVLLCDR